MLDISISHYRSLHGGLADANDRNGKRRRADREDGEHNIYSAPRRLKELQALMVKYERLGKVERAEMVRAAMRRVSKAQPGIHLMVSISDRLNRFSFAMTARPVFIPRACRRYRPGRPMLGRG
jgi:hypothetical protein